MCYSTQCVDTTHDALPRFHQRRIVIEILSSVLPPRDPSPIATRSSCRRGILRTLDRQVHRAEVDQSEMMLRVMTFEWISLAGILDVLLLVEASFVRILVRQGTPQLHVSKLSCSIAVTILLYRSCGVMASKPLAVQPAEARASLRLD